MDAEKRIVFVFHLVVFLMYTVTLIYDSVYLQFTPHRQSYGGRFKFLTFWNELIQTVYFGYSLLNDIIGSNIGCKEQEQNGDKRSALQRFRDFVAATVVFPAGLFVVSTFWGIYAINREMVYPAALDKLIPSWVNHMWHTNVIVFLLIEKYLVFHKHPSRTAGLSTTFSFGVIYQVWMFWIKFHADIWVYPLFNNLAWPNMFLFLAGCWCTLILFYIVGEVLTSLIWHPVVDMPETAVREKVQ